MAEYIEREKAYEKCGWYNTVNGKSICAARKDELAAIPAADVALVRHGRWVYKHRHRGGFRRKTGVDDTGEPHTITVDERYETDDPYCSECGKLNESVWLNYCPNCGAKMEVDHEDD